MEVCYLCDLEKPVLDSHIIPKFVFKWLKETGSGYMRDPSRPNLRLQDGFKRKLLCFECEQKFSLSEKWFAENVFYPYLGGTNHVFPYDEDFGKFVVSVLWRTAVISKEALNESPADLQRHFKSALEEWRVYLDKGIKPSTYNEFHFLLLPDGWGGIQPHRYVTCYFNRDIDGHIIQIEDECWIYVKFARFMFFGRIAGNIPSFRNTEVQLGFSSTLLGQYIDRPEITEYLIQRSEAIYKYALSDITMKQKAVIQDYFEKNIGRIKELDLGKRLMEDGSAEIAEFGYDISFRYVCDCCGSPMVEPEGYLLRTFEIILSAKYLKYYFERNGLGITKEDLEHRKQHFIQLAEQVYPWIICDICISMFQIDQVEAKKFAEEWVISKGKFIPPRSDNFRNYLTIDQINKIAYSIVTV